MTDFDPDWKHGHVTRDGRKARIICTDKKGPSPIVAVLPRNGMEDVEDTYCYLSNGRWMKETVNSEDLLNAPTPMRKGYINIYKKTTRDGFWTGSIFETEKEAIQYSYSDTDFIKTIEIEFPDA